MCFVEQTIYKIDIPHPTPLSSGQHCERRPNKAYVCFRNICMYVCEIMQTMGDVLTKSNSGVSFVRKARPSQCNIPVSL